MEKVPASTLETILVRSFAVKQTVMLWGAPGIGKTHVTKQVAQKCGYKVILLPLVFMDQTDLRGIPDLARDSPVAVWRPPALIPFKGNPNYKEGDKLLLLIDELPQAAPTLQNAVSSLIYDYRIGEFELLDSVRIVCIGNRETDRAATFRMPTHVANRPVHVEFLFDDEEWRHWAAKNDIHASIIAFSKFAPKDINNFDPERKINATPRTWEFVSRYLHHHSEPDGTNLAIFKGLVGDGPAASFIAFARLVNKVDADAIFKNPEKIRIPTEVNQLYAVCAALIERTKTQDQVDSTLIYSKRLFEEMERGGAEYATLILSSLADKSAIVKHIIASKYLKQLAAHPETTEIFNKS